MRRSRFKLQVIETNEIAGEQVKGYATVREFKVLTAAIQYAFDLWQGNPPKDARIIDEQGNMYSYLGY